MIAVGGEPEFHGLIERIGFAALRIGEVPDRVVFIFRWAARMGRGPGSGRWRSVGGGLVAPRQKYIRFGLPMEHGWGVQGEHIIIHDGTTTCTIFVGYNPLNPREVQGLPDKFW